MYSWRGKIVSYVALLPYLHDVDPLISARHHGHSWSGAVYRAERGVHQGTCGFLIEGPPCSSDTESARICAGIQVRPSLSISHLHT